MTISFTRPLLQYSLHDAAGGFVIYHPDGEVRITDCPKCGDSLQGLTTKERPDARRGTVRMMICPSCRSDISGRMIEILADLTHSLGQRDEKREFYSGDRGPHDGDDRGDAGTGVAGRVAHPPQEAYDDNPVTRARRGPSPKARTVKRPKGLEADDRAGRPWERLWSETEQGWPTFGLLD